MNPTVQQAVQQPAAIDPIRVQSIINTLAQQRNAAADQVANLSAENAVLQSRIAMLEAVNKQLMEATLPPVPPPPPEEPGPPPVEG